VPSAGGLHRALGALSNATRGHDDDDSGGMCAHDEASPGVAVAWFLLALYIFLGVAIICDEYFAPALEAISDALELSEDVAGATFLAAGSSAPELFTSMSDAFSASSGVGLGTIVGSAMFNLLVIVALSAAAAGQGGASLAIDWRPLTRDGAFYLGSIIVLTVCLIDGKVRETLTRAPAVPARSPRSKTQEILSSNPPLPAAIPPCSLLTIANLIGGDVTSKRGVCHGIGWPSPARDGRITRSLPSCRPPDPDRSTSPGLRRRGRGDGRALLPIHRLHEVQRARLRRVLPARPRRTRRGRP
jgi:hypothetical protein